MASSPVTLSPFPTGPALFERTILQIENNPANSDLVVQIIARRVDLKLSTSNNSLDGIEMARRFLPDVILMDMRMPRVSGYEALVLLRASAITSHIPVIILSSNAFIDEDAKCMEGGAFCYLTKPYRIGDLLAAIDAALLHAVQNPAASQRHAAAV